MLANEGGWDDDKAVQGSLRLVAQCVAMGGTWCMKHPQTRRMMFLELNFQWSEQMSTSWTTFKKLTTPDKLNELDENLQAPAGQVVLGKGHGKPAHGGTPQALPHAATRGLPAHGQGKAHGKLALVQSKGHGKTGAGGTGAGKAVAVDTTPPQTTEEKSKAEFNKLWADGARLRFHHDINGVSCTYIYIYIYINI